MTPAAAADLVTLVFVIAIGGYFLVTGVQLYRLGKHIRQLGIMLSDLREECDAAWGKPIKVPPIDPSVRMRYRLVFPDDPKKRRN